MTERLFTVDGAAAVPAVPVTLADAGLRERSDLQEWVLAHPEILGPDILIVTFEFDHWASAGGQERDRLDVLGIGADGRLVVAELKRDRAPDTVEMQAIKYAAMASRFTEDAIVERYLAFLRRTTPEIDVETARQQLAEHAGDLDPEQLRRPRIVLVAGSFPPVVTATAVWLTDMGLDLTLQEVHAYRVFDDRVVVSVSCLFPIADVEDFMVSPQRQQLQQARQRRRGTRERSTVVRLVDSGELADGTQLELRPTVEVGAEQRDLLIEWLAEHPTAGQATWHNDRAKPLQWAFDGGRYRPTQIVSRVLSDAIGIDASPRGPAWWVTAGGESLVELAGPAGGRGGFDWDRLHQLLAALPVGRWTTYKDLADNVGTAAMPLGGHLTRCTECPNAWRVLGADGRPRDGFRWTDPTRTGSQRDTLSREGIHFPNGAADPRQRIDAVELAQIADGG